MRYNFWAAMTSMAVLAVDTQVYAYDAMTEHALRQYDGSVQGFEQLAQMLVKEGFNSQGDDADLGLSGGLGLAQGEVEATSLADILMDEDMDDIFSDGKLALLEIGNEAELQAELEKESKKSSSDSPSSSETSSNGFSASDSSSDSSSDDAGAAQTNMQADFNKNVQGNAAEGIANLLTNHPKLAQIAGGKFRPGKFDHLFLA